MKKETRRLFLWGFLLLAVGVGQTWAEADPLPWSWTKEEMKKIEEYRKKLKQTEQGFFYYASREYEVFCNISESFTAELALYVDLFVDRFQKITGLKPRSQVDSKLRVIVYSSQEEYLKNNPQIPPWSGGIHWVDWSPPGGGLPVFYLLAYPWAETGKNSIFTQNFYRSVLQHEGSHAMLSKFCGKIKIPVFFNEGLATYLETWDLRIEKPTDAERNKRFLRSFHLRALLHHYDRYPDYRPDLASLLAIDHQGWERGSDEEISLRYGLAESFTDFMLSNPARRTLYRKMVERLYEGRMPSMLLPEEIQKLEPEWHKHIAKLLETLRSVRVAIEEGFPPEPLNEKGERKKLALTKLISILREDPRFAEGIRQVQARWPEFLEAWNSRKGYAFFAVVIPLPTGEGNSFFWKTVRVTSIPGETIWGEIVVIDPQRQQRQIFRVEVDPHEILDWYYYDAEGKKTGGFLDSARGK